MGRARPGPIDFSRAFSGLKLDLLRRAKARARPGLEEKAREYSKLQIHKRQFAKLWYFPLVLGQIERHRPLNICAEHHMMYHME